jgi:hypothetical protein
LQQDISQLLFLKFFLQNPKLYWGTLLVAQLFEALRYKPKGRGFDS